MRRVSLIVLLFTAIAAPVCGQEKVYTHGVVAADQEIASRAGAEMLAEGGNAVDAAVATSLCLSVVRPMSCGIGGGGFMLVYDPSRPAGDRAIALNYREVAPAGIGPDYFEKLGDPSASRFSGSAVGVPGTVAGLYEAHRRFGTLDWKDLVAPAIRAAEDGFTVDDGYMRSVEDLIGWYREDPSRIERFPFVWKRYLREGEVALGDQIRNPEQARALRLIARDGPRAFYQGEIGAAVIRAISHMDGALTEADLRGYRVRVIKPLEGSFMGRRILTMPPPSSGGIATLQTLGALERFATKHEIELSSLGHNTPAYIHTLTEIFKHVFADRSRWLGDADFADVPVDRLLDPAYLDSIAARIDPEHTLRSGAYGMEGATTPTPDDSGTSHFSIIDANGMAVACTETINLTFGSRIAVEEFGFCLNNEMDDFTTAPGKPNSFGLRQSDANLPAPGKRPLSSMSPTIVLGADGRVELVTGAAGGPRIITGTIQTILNTLVFGMTAKDAVSAPRFHHQFFPPVLALEPALLDPTIPPKDASPDDVMRMLQSVTATRALRSALESRGQRVGRIEHVGVVQLIRRSGDGYTAASDPRRGGAPAGIDEAGAVVVAEGASR